MGAFKSMKEWLVSIKKAFFQINDKFADEEGEIVYQEVKERRWGDLNLTLKRQRKRGAAVMGSLYTENRFLCFTLEDEIREKKIPGVTAIPEGKYEVKYTYSPKFKRKLPILLDVVGFTVIRIHSGNRASDSSGCILVGNAMHHDTIYDSKNALIDVIQVITNALGNNRRVYLAIKNDFNKLT